MTKLCALAVLACLIGADSLELPQLSRRTALAAAVATVLEIDSSRVSLSAAEPHGGRAKLSVAIAEPPAEPAAAIALGGMDVCAMRPKPSALAAEQLVALGESAAAVLSAALAPTAHGAKRNRSGAVAAHAESATRSRSSIHATPTSAPAATTDA